MKISTWYGSVVSTDSYKYVYKDAKRFFAALTFQPSECQFHLDIWYTNKFGKTMRILWAIIPFGEATAAADKILIDSGYTDSEAREENEFLAKGSIRPRSLL